MDPEIEAVLNGTRIWSLTQGDCRDVIKTLEANSVDSIVTDGPYGLEFMGKHWDRLWDDRGGSEGSIGQWQGSDGSNRKSGGVGYAGMLRTGTPAKYTAGPEAQKWHLHWAKAALRVLKPGGHLLAFGGTRTYHRLACAVEDAGFEIRDTINWCQGQGFPKSASVAKAIDDAKEHTGKIIGTVEVDAGIANANLHRGRRKIMETRPVRSTSDMAKQWEGFGTALKPSHEPIVVARKPLDGTMAENILKWGVGGLNIDGCRVGNEELTTHTGRPSPLTGDERTGSDAGMFQAGSPTEYREPHMGRWPPNLVLTHAPTCKRVGMRTVTTDGHWPEGSATGYSEGIGNGHHIYEGPGLQLKNEEMELWACEEGCPIKELDRQSGITKSGDFHQTGQSANTEQPGGWRTGPRTEKFFEGDEGGASRFFPTFGWTEADFGFFYEPKAGRAEREEGCDGLPTKDISYMNTHGGNAELGETWNPIDDRTGKPRNRFKVQNIRNTHPTVKPIELCRWLTRLVTPPGGVTVDLFAGSGSIGCAALLESFRSINIEKDPEYVVLARTRLQYWEKVGEKEFKELQVREAARKAQRTLDKFG